jgi:hypothetical protein
MQRTQARTGSSKENYVTASQGILNLIKSSYKNQKCISIKQFDKKAPSLGLFFNHQNDSLRLIQLPLMFQCCTFGNLINLLRIHCYQA